ncbi:MAG: DUF1269 domain-containing protein [Phycisphaerae bacterium]|nr:DUF1269 domain-containing protein [Saprospiraceae bacterium]
MASIIVNNAVVNPKSIHPELILDIDFVYNSELEILQSIQGILHAEDWREIAMLSQFDINPIRESLLKFRLARLNTFNQSTAKINLRATLDALALQYIEQKRMESITKDVKFFFSFRLITLHVKAPYGDDILFLETNSNGSELVIKQSDWAKHFASQLGLGKFLLVELPDMNMDKFRERFEESPFVVVRTTLKENAEKLSNTLADMNRYLVQGDFDLVLRRSREFFELLRFGKESDLTKAFRDLYKFRNGSETGFDDLYKGINEFFEFTSKFVHEKGKREQNQIKPKAMQEDAYMIYSFCLSLFNFMLQKV